MANISFGQAIPEYLCAFLCSIEQNKWRPKWKCNGNSALESHKKKAVPCNNKLLSSLSRYRSMQQKMNLAQLNHWIVCCFTEFYKKEEVCHWKFVFISAEWSWILKKWNNTFIYEMWLFRPENFDLRRTHKDRNSQVDITKVSLLFKVQYLF